MGGGPELVAQGCCCLCAPRRRPTRSPLGYARLHDRIQRDIRRWLHARAAVRDTLCSWRFSQAMLVSVEAIRACQAILTCKGLFVTPNMHFLNARESPRRTSPCSGLQPSVYSRAEEGSRAALPSRQAWRKAALRRESHPAPGRGLCHPGQAEQSSPIPAKAPTWDSR